MELFSLLAKLTLDSTDYNRGLQNAKSEADNLELDDPKLGLDDDEFEKGISDANNATVKNPEAPDLGLDDEEFETEIDEANNATVKNPTEPYLGLDDEEFKTGIDDANNATVENPEEPYLGLDDEEFNTGIEEANSAEVSDLDDPELGLDKSEFDEGLADAEEKSSLFSTSVQSIFKDLSSVIAGLGIASVVTGIVSSLKEGVDLARTHGDMVDKQSQKMNISAKAYQEYAYALNLSGASIDDLNRGLRTWQQSVGDEKKTEELAEAFKALGLDAEEALAQIASGGNLDSLLDKVMYKLADMSEGNRGALAEALFGRGATGLNAFFNQTSKDIQDVKQEASDLGLVMTDEEVKNAAAYNDAVTRLEGALNGIKESFASAILPVLTDAANTVAKIIAFFNPRTSENSFSDSLKETNKDLAKETASIEGTAEAAMEMIDKLFQMGEAEKLTAEQQKEWKATAEWLIENIPSLSDVIDTDTQQINGNKDAITANIKEWEKYEKTRAVAAAKEAKRNEFMEKNAEAIDKETTARAARNDLIKKENDAIVMANKILSQNSELASRFGSEAIDRNGDIVEQLDRVEALLWLNNDDQYELMSDVNAEFYKAEEAAQKAQQEYEKISESLETAKEQYDSWVQAIDELYGSASDSASEATSDVNELDSAIKKLPAYKQIQIDALINDNLFPHAKGSWNVPYDNYPALLHRGERVLTKSQARQADDSGGSDAIVNAIQGLRNDMQNLKLIVGQRTFARAVVDYSGNRMTGYMGEAENRTASGYGA